MHRRRGSPPPPGGPAKVRRTAAAPRPPDAPAAAAAAAPPCFPLHRDVLALVLSHLPQDYRLRAASRVCKLWRRVVLAGVRGVKLYPSPTRPHPLPLQAAVDLFPALARLTLCFRHGRVQPPKEPLRLPTSLTALHIYAAGDVTPVSFARPCPALTHLSFNVDGAYSQSTAPGPAADLILPSLSSLRSLELAGLSEWLLEHHLPSLTSLTLHRVVTDAREVAFLNRHGTQLRSLTGHLVPWRAPHTDLRLPALTALSCRAHGLESLLPSLPHLSELRIVHPLAVGIPLHDIDLVAPLVTWLRPDTPEGDFCATQLVKFTRLQRMYVPANFTENLHQFPPQCIRAVHQLTLNALPTNELWALLASCANLTRLHLCPRFRTTDAEWRSCLPQTPLRLGSLCKLALRCDTLTALRDVLAAFRTLAPLLTKVSVQAPSVPADAQLVYLCVACHSLGVESLRILSEATYTVSEDVLAFLHALPMRVVISANRAQ